MLGWTNISPGSRSTISLAGTRLSEQPIHRYSGACWSVSRRKNPGSASTLRSAQARLLAFRLSSIPDLYGFIGDAAIPATASAPRLGAGGEIAALCHRQATFKQNRGILASASRMRRDGSAERIATR